jgi:hypothetical protein
VECFAEHCFCALVPFLLAIVLYALLNMASENPFGIIKLFYSSSIIVLINNNGMIYRDVREHIMGILSN